MKCSTVYACRLVGRVGEGVVRNTVLVECFEVDFAVLDAAAGPEVALGNTVSHKTWLTVTAQVRLRVETVYAVVLIG